MASSNENKENDLNNSIMILTIDIGNGICDKLRIHNINNYEQETYDFCASNNLDFHTMREINSQIQKVIDENKIINKVNEHKNNKEKINNQNTKKIEKTKNVKSNSKKKKNIPNNNLINRYTSNPISYATQRKKDSNKNNSYGIFNSNTRISTSSSKGSSIKYKNNYNYNIIKNVKNAFNEIKKKSNNNSPKIIKKKDDLKIKNNIFNNIDDFLEYSSNTNENINENCGKKVINSEENKKILLSDFNEEKKDFNIHSKKRKESIEILNTEEINVDNKISKILENDKNINNNEPNKELINDKEEKKYNTFKNENNINKKKVENNLEENKININNKENKNKAKSERNSFNCNHKLLNHSKGKNKNSSIKNEKKKNIFNSTSQLNNKKNNRYENKHEDIIKNYKKYKEEKYKDIREKQEIELKKICTFRPSINKNSYKERAKLFFNDLKSDNNKENKNDNDKKRSKSLARFEKLYNDRICFNENKIKLKEQIEKEFSYKPKINKKATYKMGKISFNERLKLYTNKAKEKINRLNEDLEKKRKINECFKPKLNINKNKELLKEREKINDTNNKYEKYNRQYLYGQKYEKRKQYLTEKFYEDKFKSPECCQMTNDIFNHKKEKTFKKLFKILDGDNDGKISSNCINIKHLPIDIQNILEPIIYELKEENEILNETEFIFVCERYYQTLKYDQKRKLILFEDEEKKKLKKEKIEKENLNYTFKPKINNFIHLTYEKNNPNLNRLSYYEISDNKPNLIINRIKSIDIKGLNSNKISNNKIEYDKKFEDNNINISSVRKLKINDNKIIVNNISLCNLAEQKNKNNIKDSTKIQKGNKFIIQNLKNKVDREINCGKNNNDNN